MFYACQPSQPVLTEEYLKADAEYRAELTNGRNYYLKLVGLHPLVFGTNFFGVSDVNNIQLTGEGVPSTIGAIEFSDEGIWFTASDSISVRLAKNDSAVSRWVYAFDTTFNSPLLKYNNLEWQVIKRAEEYFLRVKDQNSELAKNFKGFEVYPLQSAYVVVADYQPFEEAQIETVNTQLGTEQQLEFVGALSFEWENDQYELTVGAEGFLAVGDQTNDDTTYGGGRYMYVPIPAEAGPVIVDFNRLYNPPCVYSKYTTCPLPPAQNLLPIKLEAGEKQLRL
ncbi:DUF1684 domain-containing protein [Reichenbachiella carrageenanivorans]|uniref:DUF1684 domain-containing protein n=1 Tax=Reichenbachiella carrageenanivorans TaxID=2979869 RepID=A0ABY6DAF9_9BACT|nr:DUF1684 domain-containing protein [Reichenbachiella carrageenanivorans]UXX80840.1 DUF1684 domain-containing protein [Reichenbachiella carrageenanivorans]